MIYCLNEPMSVAKFDKEILGLIFSIAEIHDHPEVEMNPVLQQALDEYTDLHVRYTAMRDFLNEFDASPNTIVNGCSAKIVTVELLEKRLAALADGGE